MAGGFHASSYSYLSACSYKHRGCVCSRVVVSRQDLIISMVAALCGRSPLNLLFTPVRSNKQKQRLTELEVEVAALSNADKGARGERAALLQRNATLQALPQP